MSVKIRMGGVSGAQLGRVSGPLGFHRRVKAWFLCLASHHTHKHIRSYNRPICCGVCSVDGVLQSVHQM